MSDDPFIDSYQDWKKQINDYINGRIELLKLEAAENIARFFSSIATNAVILYFSLLALIFISFALAYFLGDLLQSVSLGFLLTGLFYFVLAAIFYSLRKQIVEKPVIKAVIKLFFNTRNKKNNNELPSL
jgi:Zn-dependent protease with chaperone function